MLEDINQLALNYLIAPKRAKVFYIVCRGTAQEAHVKYSRLIARKKINIKWGDIICNRFYSVSYIYNGKYLIDSRKYYKGNFRIWELHPDLKFFINCQYWSDFFNDVVFFDYTKHKLEHLPPTVICGRLSEHAYRLKINNRTYHITYRINRGRFDTTITSKRFKTSCDIESIIVLPDLEL